MPWKVQTVNGAREELVRLVESGALSMAAACRRFGVSRACGHKWLARYRAEGEAGLRERSRRPAGSPAKTQAALEERVLGLREAHPRWGGRKLHRVLADEGEARPPAPSTITGILRRHGRLDPDEALRHAPVQRFERAAPNELWQMDFKGHVPCPGGRCHPLTVLDDASRYSLVLEACADETGATVQGCLTRAFLRYGLPWQMLMDNGSPWGNDRAHPYTPLGVWLLRLGIRVSHGRPYHPQTQGKDERFHRTLKAELLGDSVPWELQECQRRFDAWRSVYNWKRPHEALDLEVPGKRYAASPRPFPDPLPPVEYGPGEEVRKVQDRGLVSFLGKDYRLPKAFKGYPVALRPDPDTDALFQVYFCQQRIATINLKDET